MNRVNWPIVICVLCLITIGIGFIHSASYDPASETHRGYGLKQMIWTVLAGTLFIGISMTPYRKFRDLALPMWGVGVGLLLLVLIVGTSAKGSTRWFDLGFFRFQPSELMKVISILALARAMDVPTYLRTKQGFGYALAVLACPVFLIALEPDLGSALVLVPIGAAMFLAAGARWRHMGTAIGSCLATAPIAWLIILRDYQKIRILSFLDPASDQSGAAYQSIRSLAAVGSGKITGMGWGAGASSKLGLLPDRHTDFIFSIIAEEWGFVGSVIILGLFALLFMFSLEVAYRTRDPFGRLIVVGATTLLFFQLVVNVGMATGLAPITGLTLPLISYGGSSLLMTAVAIGLIVSVGRHEPPTISA